MLPPMPFPPAGQLEIDPVRCAWRRYRRGAAAEPLVRDWLGAQLDIAPGALALVRTAHGRPRFGPDPRRHDVSWSHSGDGLLMALGEGVQLGCDLEWLRPRPRALELARRYFTAAEADWLEALPPPRRETGFVRMWCAKEAVLKAYGRGLAFGLHRLEFAERAGALVLRACDPALGRPEAWTLHAFAPAPGYLATLAWRMA
ncbi:4'-phosphopantetheinyl transferase superfamily protein [Luteimonas sp. RD2P54]|uniref:4'-phosphopantetheinyl transferase superfamily protein n=1 Tax=Luteimonas endophytica TaxID=3042023 RepID=A0ABT6JCG8_9GAMM|nr:4'-phosphopantetheinyl transferase superfamily protein [Luteimonas endophytica]MDH5824481.1 4'-phosphopantetheinyl transferase superfamily protein [Luteimonas endophytica]